MLRIALLFCLALASCPLGACGADCKPLPTCQSLGWDGVSPLPCTFTHHDEPRTCAVDGAQCTTATDQTVCAKEDESEAPVTAMTADAGADGAP